MFFHVRNVDIIVVVGINVIAAYHKAYGLGLSACYLQTSTFCTLALCPGSDTDERGHR